MSFANKYNKGSKFDFHLGETVNYHKLSELYQDEEQVYPIKAFYINNKSKFGNSPVVAIAKDMVVNLPMHMLDTVNDIMSDDESVEQINRGEAGFSIYKYSNKYGTQYNINFVDMK